MHSRRLLPPFVVLSALALLGPACDPGVLQELAQTPELTPLFLQIDEAAVTLIMVNEAGVPVRADAVFRQGSDEVRRTSRYLAPSGQESVTVVIPTLADTLTVEARESADLSAAARAGDLLAERTFVIGVDFQPGDEITFTITKDEILTNLPPSANLIPEITAVSGDVVTLDASQSSDPEGESLSFRWEQIEGPGVTLSSISAMVVTFTAPQVSAATTLRFRLTLTTASISASPSAAATGQTTAEVRVLVVPRNRPPVADAGPDQTVAPGAVVTLDGRGSSDPDGDALRFKWTQIGGPTVAIADTGSPTAQFTAPNLTVVATEEATAEMSFRLEVFDPFDARATDDVTIRIVPVLPLDVALSATPDVVTPGDKVRLVGEAQGGTPPYTFEWKFAGPPESGPGDIDVESETVIRWTAPADGVGNWTATLTATDSLGETASAQAAFVVASDCNTNLAPDSDEISSGWSPDCDTNGVPDECDLADGADDCNTNGVPDGCDIAFGTSGDENADGVPDECDTWWCPTRPGDLNGDGHVDGDDLECFISCKQLGESNCESCACADMDADGDIDDVDYSLFMDRLYDKYTECP